MAPTDPDLRDYNVAFNRMGELLDFRPTRTIEDGITEILERAAQRARSIPTIAAGTRCASTNFWPTSSGRGTTWPWTARALLSAAAGMERIEFYKHDLGEAEIASVAKTLHIALPDARAAGGGVRAAPSGHFSGSEHVVGVSSCTMGLVLALEALGIGPGDEVITTPMTFISTPNAALFHGAVPVFADVDPHDGPPRSRSPSKPPSLRAPAPSSWCTSTASSPTCGGSATSATVTTSP